MNIKEYWHNDWIGLAGKVVLFVVLLYIVGHYKHDLWKFMLPFAIALFFLLFIFPHLLHILSLKFGGLRSVMDAVKILSDNILGAELKVSNKIAIVLGSIIIFVMCLFFVWIYFADPLSFRETINAAWADMAAVVLIWGGGLILFLVLLKIFNKKKRKKRKR
ncbi:MAG: hypothetical protein KJ574_01810 [Nanoarchaeota archaeon]|nr:hypothetical protein [Nanoarchaeota archaeon]